MPFFVGIVDAGLLGILLKRVGPVECWDANKAVCDSSGRLARSKIISRMLGSPFWCHVVMEQLNAQE